MSNCIQVDNDYHPFRWVGNQLEAWVNERWQPVERTDRRNEYKEWIFQIKPEENR